MYVHSNTLEDINKPKRTIQMVERVKKFTDILLKTGLESKNEFMEERLTIVLASYQEGQVNKGGD